MRELLRPVFCLLIEASPVVGLDLADALDARGYYVAGPFPCGRQAFKWLARFTPDVAIVDLILQDGPCLELIRQLQAEAIPFIIYSGLSVRNSPFELASNVPWLEKPASDEVIATALQGLLSVGGSDITRPAIRIQQTDHLHPKQKLNNLGMAQEVIHEP
jgi:DNA-binding NarL/FixJ family response regulator